MNDPSDYDAEVARGFIKLHSDSLIFPKNDLRQVIRKEVPEVPQTALIGVCDGGHMPAFAGYVGKGMLHGAATGKTFEAAKAEDIFEVIKQADMGKGCILIPLIWNEEASEELKKAVFKAEKENIKVSIAEIRDDCMQPKENKETRLSSAGVFFACKTAGAAAEEGKDLEQILTLLKKVNENMRSAANCGTSFSLPGSKTPFMQIDDGMMQVGIGIHGEPGFEMVSFPSAYEIAEHLFRHRLNKELNFQPNEKAAVLINDLGSTTLDELMIIYGIEAQQFENKGTEIIKAFLGRYLTILDADGVSITALRLDDELEKYLLNDSDAPVFRQTGL